LASGRWTLGRCYNRQKKAAHDGGKGKTRSRDQNDPQSEKTAEEIGEAVGLAKNSKALEEELSRILEDLLKSGKVTFSDDFQPPQSRAAAALEKQADRRRASAQETTDFQPPIYNV
jgi:hypothetical protein